MSELTAFTYVLHTEKITMHDAFVVRVAGEIQTQQQLFEFFYRELAMPEYFGFNWNALFDCLRDLHWVSQKKVLIVHDDLPRLPPSELKTYFEVLRDSVLDWKPGEAHCLEVVFDENVRAHIEDLISEV